MKRLSLSIAIILLILATSQVLTAFADGKIIFAFESLTYDVAAGKTITIKPVMQGYKGKTTYIYSSSDSSVATVSKDGKVKGISKGAAVITCTAITKEKEEYNAKYTINVLQPVEKITSDVKELTMTMFQAVTPSITIVPDDASKKDIVWTSSNTSVAEVYTGGKIRAFRSGKATITGTATDGSGAKVTIKVNVPTLTYEPGEIIIDSLDGIEFYTWINDGGYFSTSIDYGDLLYEDYEAKNPYNINTPGDDYHKFAVDYHLLKGKKPGTGKMTLHINGSKKSIPVTVLRNAVYANENYETLCSEESVNLPVELHVQVMEYYPDTDDKYLAYLENAPGQPIAITTPLLLIQHDSAMIDGIVIGHETFISDTGLEYNRPIVHVTKAWPQPFVQ